MGELPLGERDSALLRGLVCWNPATERLFYRTLADIPGEAFGGSRRRYREVYRMVTPDSIASTLHWFHDGAWRPYGRFAEGGFVRIR